MHNTTSITTPCSTYTVSPKSPEATRKFFPEDYINKIVSPSPLTLGGMAKETQVSALVAAHQQDMCQHVYCILLPPIDTTCFY